MLRAVVALVPQRVRPVLFRFWLDRIVATKPADDALRELFALDHVLRDHLNEAAIAYDGGVHAKHRLMAYHDFFVERVRPGERVLDLGCGKGELAFDLADRAGAHVVGIDSNPAVLAFARARFQHPQLRFVEADVMGLAADEPADVVVLSNVLEHIEDRPELLRHLTRAASPSRFLIRVPVLERDWTIPLRHELGVPHFSHDGHFVEYDQARFEREMREAGLEIVDLKLVWGEIWAELRVSGGRGTNGPRARG
jgi:SAM-dependent methyltransferase